VYNGMDVIHKRTKRRRYINYANSERYTANHYALPMCQANLSKRSAGEEI